MNTHFRDITKKLIRHRQGLRDPQIMHPEREWIIALALMVGIFSASAGWSMLVYLKNMNVSPNDVVVEQQQTIVYRENSVDEALALFEKRAYEQQMLIGAMSGGSEVSEEVATSSDEFIGEMATTTEMATSTESEEVLGE
ncbi:MAG: hypothetical protein RL538_641 [Candidatus Parcubacteria bacterium]|jgi:hypothetical protein